MSGLLRPLGSAALSPSHHWQPWYQAQLGGHLLPPSLPGPSYSICLFCQPETILKVLGEWWIESELLYSLHDQKGSQASQKVSIKSLSIEIPVSPGKHTACQALTFSHTWSPLYSFGGIILVPEHSKQFPTLWPFPQVFLRTRCHPIPVVPETLLVNLVCSFLCKHFERQHH